MNAASVQTCVIEKQIAKTSLDHIFVSVSMDTQEMEGSVLTLMNAQSGFTIVNLTYSVKTLRVFLPANVRKASLGMALIVKTSMHVSLTYTPAVRMHFAWTALVNSLAYVIPGIKDLDISAKLSVRQYSFLFVSSFRS